MTDVNQTTPTVSWTFTGRTQLAFQVMIYRVSADAPDELVYDTGQVKSPLTVHGVPSMFDGKRVIDRELQDYQVVVRIWDDIGRQDIQGDLAYVEDTETFQYVNDGTPAPVTALTAAQNGAGVVLEWQRTSKPDYFAIKIDGVIVEDRIMPDDVFVSGTTYRKTVYGSEPNTAHEYEVEAVVSA